MNPIVAPSAARGLLCVLGMTVIACTRENASPDRAARTDSLAPAVRYDQHVSAGGIIPPGAEPKNPFAGNARAVTEGKALFASMNCDGCHGGGAEGWVGPSLIDGRWRYGGSDGALFQSIFYGRPEGMPAFGGAAGSEVAWKIVAYLRTLPTPKAVPTQRWDNARAAPNR